MFWCVCICMHAYICVCMHAWEYEHLGACTCVFICTLMCVRMHACMYIFAISRHKYLSWHRWLPLPPILKSFLCIWAKQQFLGHRLKHKIILLSFLKVRKDAKITLKYQIWTRTPHRGVIKHNTSPHTREPGGQPFLSRWPQDCNK